MGRRRFKAYTIVTMAVVGALVGWSITTGNALLPALALVGGVGLMYLARKRVREVIEDERIYKISEKASRVTVQVSAVAFAAAGLTLLALSRNVAPDYAQAAFTLAYCACGLLVLYTALYMYYSTKM